MTKENDNWDTVVKAIKWRKRITVLMVVLTIIYMPFDVRDFIVDGASFSTAIPLAWNFVVIIFLILWNRMSMVNFSLEEGEK